MNEHKRGALLGMLLGDAVGVPYEFHTPEDIQDSGKIDYPYPNTLDRRAHTSAPDHAWSDDGAQALALLDACVQDHDFVLDTFKNKMLNWYTQQAYCVDGRLFDIGNQTRIAMRNALSGKDPEECGPSQEANNGNGSLMRTLALNVWGQVQGVKLVELAHDASLLTHGHLRSHVCCAFLCLYGEQLEQGSRDRSLVYQTLKDIYTQWNDPECLEELDKVWVHQHDYTPGSPYVVDTLWSAIEAFEQGVDFKDTVRRAIAMGNDTDTTACIAGGLAGLAYGADQLPEDWLKVLPKQRDLERLLNTCPSLQAQPTPNSGSSLKP